MQVAGREVGRDPFKRPHQPEDSPPHKGLALLRTLLHTTDTTLSEILPGLYLSSLKAANAKPATVSVTHVVTCCRFAPKWIQRIPKDHHLVIGEIDKSSTDLRRHFPPFVAFVHRARRDPNARILVHCVQGISRSSTLLCAYVMTALDKTYRESLGYLRRRRRVVCPNAGFCKQLRAFEGSAQQRACALVPLARDEAARRMPLVCSTRHCAETVVMVCDACGEAPFCAPCREAHDGVVSHTE